MRIYKAQAVELTIAEDEQDRRFFIVGRFTSPLSEWARLAGPFFTVGEALKEFGERCDLVKTLTATNHLNHQ